MAGTGVIVFRLSDNAAFLLLKESNQKLQLGTFSSLILQNRDGILQGEILPVQGPVSLLQHFATVR